MKKPKIGCFGWLLFVVVVAAFYRYPWLWFIVIVLIAAIGFWFYSARNTAKAKSKLRARPLQPSGKVTSSPTYGVTRSLAQATDDSGIEVVGESFYEANFDQLRGLLKAEFGTEHQVELRLVNEPDNPHSDNGCAVAVYCRGLMIGHISEDENEEFFELLATAGGVAYCQGRVYFSPKSNLTMNSVFLLVSLPPRFL